MGSNRSWRSGLLRAIAVVAFGTLMLSACGGESGGGTGGGGGNGSTPAEESSPSYGGRVVYALEAENAEGWCLPQAQLAISGIQVARTIYDTLTIPNQDGELVPFLAEDLTHNDDFTEWNIKIREGVKFHDGSDLNAIVVKNNLDAYRGQYKARKPLLFIFVFDNIADVKVVDEYNVQVTTKTPWSSFPQALWSSGRIGMMGQSQLDDPETCDSKLIGTGPFELVDWKKNEKLVVKKNPDYWMKDEDGNSLPYLDEIEYRPIVDGSARVNALLAGDVTMLHMAALDQIDLLNGAAEEGKIQSTTSDKFTEVAFVQLNNSKLPFSNKNARMALASAMDMETFNQTINLGIPKIANGPFAPGNMGYIEDTGYPTYDPEAAKEYVAKYKEETGKDLEFTIIGTPDPSTQAALTFAQDLAKKVGVKVNIATMEQAALVSTAIAGDFEAMAFRNFPGGDPDANHVWWYGKGNPVNFSRYDDPEINRLLDEGRLTDDKAERQEIYAEINKRFASEVYSIWLTWSIWDMASANDIHGLLGPRLPNGDDPSPALVVGHSVAGLWLDD